MQSADCACRGLAPQMRQHGPLSCSILTDEEADILYQAAFVEKRALTPEEFRILEQQPEVRPRRPGGLR